MEIPRFREAKPVAAQSPDTAKQRLFSASDHYISMTSLHRMNSIWGHLQVSKAKRMSTIRAVHNPRKDAWGFSHNGFIWHRKRK